MLRNLFNATLRSFSRNWNYALINSLGLCVGIGSCLIIFLIINFELSFDDFHAKKDRIYRVVHDNVRTSGTKYQSATPYPFHNAFVTDFPDIGLVTQIHYDEAGEVTFGTEKMKVKDILFCDSLFFNVFDFEVISGNPRKDLGHPGKVFLTESLAKKIMKSGSTPKITLGNKLELEIAGIVKDPPANSHLSFSMIISMPTLSSDYLGLPLTEWRMTRSAYNYLVLPQTTQPAEVEKRLGALVDKYYKMEEGEKYLYHLQSLNDIHFSDRYQGNPSDAPGGSKSNLLILSLLGVFILIVACINFINLSTALAMKKSREVGIRKTLGASRPELIRQFMLEAFVLTVFSTAIAIVVVELMVQPLGQFLGKEIHLNITQPNILFFLTGITIFTAISSGFYPAFVVSRFNPIAVLRHKFSTLGSSGATTRKYLVIFQFLITQVLITCTLVVANQMEYFHSKPLGFSKDAIINVALPENTKEKRETFKALLSSAPGVERVTLSLGAPTSDDNLSTNFFLTERGKENQYDVDIKPADFDYLRAYGLEMVAGHWFGENDERATELPKEERTYNYIVNEALVKELGFSSNEEIIGKKITTGLNQINAPVIGVVRDFHTKSLRQKVEPAILIHFSYFYREAGIKIIGTDMPGTLSAIEKAYSKVFPNNIFEYKFLDERIGNLYREEAHAFSLMKIFAGLSIFISCLGLFGLVSFLTNQKVREVGIRKVFGASVSTIVYLFSKDFIGLIITSFIIAVPIVSFLMSRWLEGFAYHTVIGVSAFVIAIVSTIVIAIATVSYQSIRAAIANPIDSLRSE